MVPAQEPSKVIGPSHSRHIGLFQALEIMFLLRAGSSRIFTAWPGPGHFFASVSFRSFAHSTNRAGQVPNGMPLRASMLPPWPPWP